jgi:hypothetical protein
MAWRQRVYGLRGSSLGTALAVQRWLRQFTQVFGNGMLTVSYEASYQKARQAFLVAGIELSRKEFKESFYDIVMRFCKADLTRAKMLERSLARRFGKDYERFFAKYDELIANLPGAPLRQVQKAFENTAVFKHDLALIDSAGKEWDAGAYADMYSRTRSAEVSDAIQLQTADELGLDVCKITEVNYETCPICMLYAGKYFSLFGETKGLPVLDIRPPFHPNCRHKLIMVPPDGVPGYISKNERKDQEIRKARSMWSDEEEATIASQIKYKKRNQYQLK